MFYVMSSTICIKVDFLVVGIKIETVQIEPWLCILEFKRKYHVTKVVDPNIIFMRTKYY